jgi:hypothetical protein
MNLSHEMQPDGTVKVTIVGTLPQPSTAENPKYPWVPWNLGYSNQQIEKDAARVLQSIANLKVVETTLASRAAVRAEQKSAKALVATAVAAQSQPAQPTVEVAAPAPSPTPAAKSSTKSRKGKRS